MLNRVYDVMRPGNNGSRARLVRTRAPRFATGGKALRCRRDAPRRRHDAPRRRRDGVGVRCGTRVASRVTSRLTPGVATGLHGYNYGID